MTNSTIRVGVVGWGLAGRAFHGPFVHCTEGLELAAVVTSRQPDPSLYPQVQVLPTLEALLADPTIGVVVIATPNELHMAQATAALQAGKHVVVDKPVVETAAEMRQLMQTAEAAGKLLIPFQNRRWDGDFRTVEWLINDNWLGEVYHYEAKWPRYKPQISTRAGWKNAPGRINSVVYDLGAHLIDQVLCLFGLPQSVYAQIGTHRPQSGIDDYFHLHLRFPHGVTAVLEVDMLNPVPVPRFHVRGTEGTFTKYGLDPQEPRLVAGELPTAERWGEDDPQRYGTLLSAPLDVRLETTVSTRLGNYLPFYEGVYAAVAHGAAVPVPPQDVVNQLHIIEQAFISAATNQLQQLTF